MMEGKMEISKKLWDGEQPKPLHSYTAQAQDFKKKSASPILTCLEPYFNNDLSRFYERGRDTFFHAHNAQSQMLQWEDSGTLLLTLPAVISR